MAAIPLVDLSEPLFSAGFFGPNAKQPVEWSPCGLGNAGCGLRILYGFYGHAAILG